MNKKIIIFGCGQAGKQAFQMCLLIGIKVFCFADNDQSKHGQDFCGLPICSPVGIDKKSVVIVASSYEEPIYHQLKAQGVENIFLLNDLKMKYPDYNRSLNNNRSSLDEKLQEKIKKNELFLGRHSGDRCFILATGPSIKEQNLIPLKNEICFAVGQFYLHNDIKTIAPQYYVCPCLHKPFGFDFASDYFRDSFAVNSSNTEYFLGYNKYEESLYNYISSNNIDDSNIYQINYHGREYLSEDNYNEERMWDITGTPFAVRTVIYMAVQIAVYMGFKEIYLLGCDHDYLQDVTRVSDHHFYPEEKGHSDVEVLSQFTSEKWFHEYYLRWKDYRLMQQYLTSKGVKIYNATKGGMLDVFPRVKLEDIV